MHSKKIKALVFIMMISLTWTSCTSEKQKRNDQTIVQVDNATFQKLITEGDGILIDVRTEEEIANGVIDNPLKIDFSSSDFSEQLDQLPKDSEIYIYCAVGGRSGKAAEILKDKGYSKIYNLEGGYEQWKKEGFPTN